MFTINIHSYTLGWLTVPVAENCPVSQETPYSQTNRGDCLPTANHRISIWSQQ